MTITRYNNETKFSKRVLDAESENRIVQVPGFVLCLVKSTRNSKEKKKKKRHTRMQIPYLDHRYGT